MRDKIDWENQHRALVEIAPDLSKPPLQEQLLEDFIALPLSFPKPVVWTTDEGRLEAVGEIRTRFHVKFSDPTEPVDEEVRALLDSLEPEEKGRGSPVFALRLRRR